MSDVDLDLGPLSEGPVGALAPVAQVMARGNRRRRRARSAAALGVVALFGGVAVGVSSLGRDSRSTVEQFAPPSPSTTTAAPSLPADGVDEALLTLADADTAEPGAWERFGEAGQNSLLDPCGGTAYPIDTRLLARGSTALRALREAGGTSALQQIARYSEATAAEDAWAGYRRAVAGCPERDEAGVPVTHEVLSETAYGDVRTLLVRRGCGDDCVLGNFVYYAVQQVDDLVAVTAVSQGEDGDPGEDIVKPFAGVVAERLSAASN